MPLPKPNIDRLEIQLDIMRKIVKSKRRRARFNMTTFGQHDPQVFDTACGTAHCAFGEACFDPRLQAMGLKAVVSYWWDCGKVKNIIKVFKTIEDFNEHSHAINKYMDIIPTYKGCEGYIAAAEFYGIGYDEAKFLFDPAKYSYVDEITPEMVRDRIAFFINQKKKYPTVGVYEQV